MLKVLVFIGVVLLTVVQGFIVRKDLSSDISFQQHPCRRECQQGESLICHYQLVVHYRQALGPECVNCVNDPSACQDEGCIYADGIPNIIMTINNMWPAPAIEVCENDTIVADVVNQLDEDTTMHWHGMHMAQSKDMDGAPYITQYPIVPNGTYRYIFPVDRSGTIWYHSHMFYQRATGVAAPFVIRQPKESDPHADLYDYDLSEHVLLVTDIDYNPNYSAPQNILINGKGRNHVNSWPDNDARHRYEQLNVTHGQRYRMRIISNGVSNCPIEVTIENHKVLVIATDGNNIEPMLADSFFLTSAERVDFILEANQAPGKYWLNVKGHANCANQNLYQNAVLNYAESLDAFDIYSQTNMEFSMRESFSKVNVLAELATTTKEQTRAMQIDDVTTVGLRSLESLPWPYDTEFTTYYTSFGILRKNNIAYMQVDDIQFVEPQRSLLQDNNGSNEGFCNRTTFIEAGIDCITTNCKCTHVMKMSAYQAIELIVANYMDSTHPFHLHGFTFRVVGQEALGDVTELRNIRDLNERGLLTRLPADYPAVEKDTVQVPALGYVILRFISDNPGYWLFHCHIERHALLGMMGVLHVEE